MIEQRVERPWRQAVNFFAVVLGVLLDEEVDQSWNVSLSLAQRWQGHRDHVQSIIEILSKASGLHFRREIAVGGGYQSNVYLDRLGSADPFEFPLLQDAQERSEEHTSELQSRQYLVCRLLLEKKK